ncbi:TPA: hypothetical protein DD449_04805 [Candidatus Berkelbacteria bacterium]|uniref:Heliorhodopsin HeR n=1 Tax=Berkelbacteria bacterium GW2011_GWE1_39_12 TaxID=1618337 RepID=A0A0G4B3G3_9BACT|nr:MAG: hypothetical protein UT28_C0001G0580 [Berkelbacteria bacterium GW2011_GWE1_39_12]HBO60975.1 hypothetical protein [Candidatus Berkelbacteria bacterium]
MGKKLQGLKKFNLLMAFLHFGQGVAMLFLSSNFSLPVNASFLSFDFLTQKLVPENSVLYDLRIGPAIAVFLFISALAHLLVSTVLNKWYNENLAKGINYARWIEYSFSSSIMIVIIAMLVGVYDIAALILIFTLNAMMILFGWMMELHNQTTSKTNWTSFYFGCIAGIVPWIVIAIYLFGAHDKAPNFVYWLYFSIFLFFNCFAINQILQYKKVGKWANYLYGERDYIILSLVAKSLLAWQVFGGTLRP